MAQAEYRKTQAMNIFLIDCHQDMQKELECVPYKCSVFFHVSSKFWVVCLVPSVKAPMPGGTR
jgi:hypothetical protein